MLRRMAGIRPVTVGPDGVDTAIALGARTARREAGRRKRLQRTLRHWPGARLADETAPRRAVEARRWGRLLGGLGCSVHRFLPVLARRVDPVRGSAGGAAGPAGAESPGGGMSGRRARAAAGLDIIAALLAACATGKNAVDPAARSGNRYVAGNGTTTILAAGHRSAAPGRAAGSTCAGRPHRHRYRRAGLTTLRLRAAGRGAAGCTAARRWATSHQPWSLPDGRAVRCRASRHAAAVMVSDSTETIPQDSIQFPTSPSSCGKASRRVAV